MLFLCHNLNLYYIAIQYYVTLLFSIAEYYLCFNELIDVSRWNIVPRF